MKDSITSGDWEKYSWPFYCCRNWPDELLSSYTDFRQYIHMYTGLEESAIRLSVTSRFSCWGSNYFYYFPDEEGPRQ